MLQYFFKSSWFCVTICKVLLCETFTYSQEEGCCYALYVYVLVPLGTCIVQAYSGTDSDSENWRQSAKGCPLFISAGA
jgi:hypothetical protein